MENDEARMVRAGLALNDEGMQLLLLLVAGTGKQFFLLGFLISRDRARIFQVVAIKPGRKWRRPTVNQIAGRVDDRARFLFHNDPGSISQAVGHPLSDMNNFVGGCRELNDLS